MINEKADHTVACCNQSNLYHSQLHSALGAVHQLLQRQRASVCSLAPVSSRRGIKSLCCKIQ